MPAARRSARLLLVAAALVAAACSAGGSPAAERAPGPGPADPPILFLGDSLTVGARLWGDLGATMVAAGWRPEVVAEDGQDVRWGLDQVRGRDRVPAVVVVGLGTNPGRTPGTFAADAGRLVDELGRRGARTIVWWPPGDTSDPGRAARVAALRAAAGGGRLRVPDWPGLLARHRGWLAPDGIHLTPDGYRHLVDFLRDQVGPPPGPR